MFQGLEMVKISTPFVEKILNQPALTQNISNIWALGINTAGHMFYVLTIVPLNVTLVYDMTSQTWSTWSSVVGGVEQYFTGRFYLRSEGQQAIIGDTMQDVSTGYQMQMQPTYYTDATGPINVTCVSTPYDWKTSNYKRFNYMSQLSDFINTSISISYTDNDYQSFSTPRVMALTGPRSQLRNCGSSRRRAWKMFHQDNTPLRLYEVRMDMDILAR
jgi:hypothetical protein